MSQTTNNQSELKGQSVFEYPLDRLATTTETGRRVYLYPAFVKGKFRQYRNVVYDALILFFLILPWIKINGTPLLLLNILKRQFSIFGLTFWADDAPMLIFVLGGSVLIIAFITALLGRAWCGWACPQTVFIDRIYRRIEGWIEGSPNQRRKLDKQRWNGIKIFKRSLKYSLYLIVSLIIANSFLAYFVSMDTVRVMVTQSPLEHPSAFFIVAIATAITLFDFGWFREQFCIIACPYGRLQSVMLDDQSLIIGYDAKRGEPRHSSPQSTQPDKGDCINCYRCVQVCPTGIDIRRGLQMECIMCSACVDACNAVMVKTKKPQNLISYTTEAKLQGSKSRTVKPRLAIYGLLILVFASGLIWTLMHRSPLRVFVNRGRSGYEIVQNHTIINHFKLHLYNYQFHKATVQIQANDKSHPIKLIIPQADLTIEPGKTKIIDLFIEIPESEFQQGKAIESISISAKFNNTPVLFTHIEPLPLVGPDQ